MRYRSSNVLALFVEAHCFLFLRVEPLGARANDRLDMLGPRRQQLPLQVERRTVRIPGRDPGVRMVEHEATLPFRMPLVLQPHRNRVVSACSSQQLPDVPGRLGILRISRQL